MLIDLPTLINNIGVKLRCITAKQAAQEIDQHGGLVVDVREPSEAEANPVNASINIPRGIIEMKMLEKVSDPNNPIYLHCASGVRAKLAAEQLIKNIKYCGGSWRMKGKASIDPRICLTM